MKLKNVAMAAGMILSAAFAFADNGTEFGIDDDLTVWGTQGSTADADVEIKGFTMFGSTTASNLAVYSGTGSVFMGGALEVSSNTYLRGSVVVGTTPSQGIFAVKDNFVVTTGGNVGIGTTSPGTALVIQAKAGGDAVQINGSAAQYGYLQFMNNDGTTLQGSLYGVTGRLTLSDSAGTDVLTIKSGDIGIGTTGPLNRLEVVGTQPYANGATSLATSRSLATAIIHGSSDASAAVTIGNIANTGTHYLQNSNYNGSAYYDIVLDPYGGNIGIGTISPSKNLEVDYTGSDNIGIGEAIRFDQPGSGVAAIGFNVASSLVPEPSSSKAGIGLLRQGGQGTGSLVFYNRGTADTSDFTALDERMRIDSNGNVGIGTTGPTAKLDVEGSVGIGINSSGGQSLLSIGPGGAGHPSLILRGYNYGVDGKYSNIYYNSDLSALLFGMGGANAMTIGYSGNVRIANLAGTGARCVHAGADGTLGVVNGECGSPGTGNIVDTLSDTLVAGNNAGGRDIINLGNVGIGTTAPGQVLSLESANPIEKINYTNTANYGGIYLYENGTFRSFIQQMGSAFSDGTRARGLEIGTRSDPNSFIAFRPQDAEGVRITSGGNVGIGTTGPGARLDVRHDAADGNNSLAVRMSGAARTGYFENTMNNGGSNRWGFFINTSGNENYLAGQAALMVDAASKGPAAIFSNGNVGIGTTGPNAKLQIYGGDAYTSGAGNGFIVKSPDGTKCGRVGIDNTGNLALTAITCP